MNKTKSRNLDHLSLSPSDMFEHEDGEVYIIIHIGCEYCLASLRAGDIWVDPTDHIVDVFDGDITKFKRVTEVTVTKEAN